MKATLVLLPALAALCHGAALPQDGDIVAREQGWDLWKKQVTVVVTKTTTKTTAPAVYTTSTKYTTLPTPVITKTSTVTKPYTTPIDDVSTVIVTVTGKPTTVTPPAITVTVTAKTSSSAKPPVTVTVTVAPPEETEEPEEPSTTDNSWQITRTLPPLTFGKRDPSPAPEPEAEPQRGNRPTRWGNWGPGGQTVVQTQTVKETVTYYPPTSTGITKTITITPTVSSSLSTSITTIYYTPPPSTTKPATTVTYTATVVPTITAGPTTITKTLTPTPTPKSTVKSTITIWDGAFKGKRSPQTLGLPSRTANTLPTETEYPDPEEEDPGWEDREYPEEEPTYVLGPPTRTVNVSPTPVKPTTTKKPPPPKPTNEFSLGQPSRTVNVSPTPGSTTSKKPWWYSPPKTMTVTNYLPPKPTPTGTLIMNSGTIPVLTLGGKRAAAATVKGKRQAADADVTRSATFALGAPVKSVPVFVTSTKKP
ncbi:hypothetical protein ACEPPN_003926 [Leptodophora sp. 'Broadleaf-Isolate-01']